MGSKGRVMLWCIVHIPSAEYIIGTGGISANEGFFEQFYTNVALFDSKEAAEEEIIKLTTNFNKYDIPEHYMVIEYDF